MRIESLYGMPTSNGGWAGKKSMDNTILKGCARNYRILSSILKNICAIIARNFLTYGRTWLKLSKNNLKKGKLPQRKPEKTREQVRRREHEFTDVADLNCPRSSACWRSHDASLVPSSDTTFDINMQLFYLLIIQM